MRLIWVHGDKIETGLTRRISPKWYIFQPFIQPCERKYSQRQLGEGTTLVLFILMKRLRSTAFMVTGIVRQLQENHVQLFDLT